jgi:predicted nucleic acid-binding Zn ribbon protein
MPTYVYRVVKPDGRLGLTFKVQQSMRDAPLTHHPVTRQPVVRVPQAPMVQRPGSSHHGHGPDGCCPGCK